MARKCSISGKGGQSGHRVSHANNKTNHIFKPNLQVRRIFDAEQNKFIKVRLSTRMIRTLDKLGVQETLKKYNVSMRDLRG